MLGLASAAQSKRVAERNRNSPNFLGITRRCSESARRLEREFFCEVEMVRRRGLIASSAGCTPHIYSEDSPSRFSEFDFIVQLSVERKCVPCEK